MRPMDYPIIGAATGGLIRKFATIFLLTAICFSSGLAAAKDEVTVKLTASKVVKGEDGRHTLAPADAAKPGDVLEYAAVYRNQTGGAVKGLEATVPIPAGLELLPDSAKPAGALASADGKDFAAQPLMTKADGKPAALPLEKYRALRWTIPQLAAEAEVTVTLRARVLTNLPKSNQPDR